MSLMLFIVVLMNFPQVVYADIGPKPTAKMYVEYNGLPLVGRFEAAMLSCNRPRTAEDEVCQSSDTADCNYDPTIPNRLTDINDVLLKDYQKGCYWRNSELVWGGDCGLSQCTFTYFLPESFKIAVKLPSSDQVYITNDISRLEFHSSYRVSLRSNGEATITDTTFELIDERTANTLMALGLTIIVEWLVSLLFFFRRQVRPIFILPLIIGNAISVPIVWYFSSFYLDTASSFILLGITEAFALVIETIIYSLFYKKQIHPILLFIYTLVANIASYVIGLFILI